MVVLQRQVDELDELKAGHYAEIVEHEEEVWDVVQGKVCLVQLWLSQEIDERTNTSPRKMCLVVRSTLDVFDKFTSKA